MQKITSMDQLGLTLNADDIAGILGISRAGAYTLLHSEGFPRVRIGKRILVPRDQFLAWIQENTQK